MQQQIHYDDSLPTAISNDPKLDSHSFAESDIPHSTVIDLPPDSFWLSKDSEFDWFDQNAFLQRNESTKANSNINYSNSNSNSNSSRYYSVKVKSKAAIIGLPKPQKTSYVDSKRRQCNVRLFPKRLDSIGKVSSATVLVTEPSSPKVSCIGRVRSKRCRSRKKSSEFCKSTSQRSGKQKQKQKGGLMSRLTSLFRSDGDRRRKNGKVTEKVIEKSGSRRICVSVGPVYSEPATPSEPIGLGGMVRFASGRRLEYWDGDDVAGCHSVDLARRV